MTPDFAQLLCNALLADYYHVGNLQNNGLLPGLKFICKKSLYPDFSSLFDALDIGYIGLDPEKENSYCLIAFKTEQDKEKAEDYFINFNLESRQLAMIALPDLFEGKGELNELVCEYYRDAIEKMMRRDLTGAIAIPHGISVDSPNERAFMVYDQNGMRGLYRGTQLFKDQKISYVDGSDT